MTWTYRLLVGLCLLGLTVTAAHCAVNVPITGLKLVPASGLQVSLELVPDGDEGLAVERITFNKGSDERRLVVLEGKPQSSPAGAQALALRYRLTLGSGKDLKPAVVIFDADGGSWYKVGGQSLEGGEFTSARISVASLRQTAFSEDKSGELEWDAISRVWVGFVVDGPAGGTFELSSATLTDVPYKPTKPFRLTGEGIGKWGVGQDPAVKSTLTTPDEGPDGQPCMKYEFTVPGSAHMYALPSTAIVAGELEGYTALRFKYRSGIPDGMRMLITLSERSGAQWYCEPAGPWSSEWTEMMLPLTQFQQAGWGAKDPNGKLDIADVGTVITGTHGAAKVAGPGWFMVTDIEFVP